MKPQMSREVPKALEETSNTDQSDNLPVCPGFASRLPAPQIAWGEQRILEVSGTTALSENHPACPRFASLPGSDLPAHQMSREVQKVLELRNADNSENLPECASLASLP
jgi:hypothetical protein